MSSFWKKEKLSVSAAVPQPMFIPQAARYAHFHPVSSSRNAFFEMASERRLPTFRAKRITRGFTRAIAVFVAGSRLRRVPSQASKWHPSRKWALMDHVEWNKRICCRVPLRTRFRGGLIQSNTRQRRVFEYFKRLSSRIRRKWRSGSFEGLQHLVRKTSGDFCFHFLTTGVSICFDVHGCRGTMLVSTQRGSN